MYDVLLINPRLSSTETAKRSSEDLNVAPPLGAVCLGGYLEKSGYKPKIINAIMDENVEETIRRYVDDVICVGISAKSAQVGHAVELAEYIRSINPNVPLVWGGVHPTFFPKQTCEDSLVDFVVVGEGEQTLLELVEALSRDKNDFSKIDGLVYKQNGGVKMNPLRKFLDMDKLPFLAWHLLDVEKYVNAEIGDATYRLLSIHSSRGCPHRCTFCINTIINRRIWRSMSAERVLEEIEFIVNKYKINCIWFREENFFGNKKRVEEICRGIKDRGLDIKWLSTIRADYFKPNYLNSEFVKLLKDSGCIRLSMGIESGSSRILKYIKKDEEVEDSIRSAELCNKYGIIPIYSFMTGLPTETRGDTLMTIALIKKLKRIAPKAEIIGPQVFRPYPGSEMYDWCREHGFKEPQKLRGWINPKALMETGYVSADDLPWVENPDFTTLVSLSVPYSSNMGIREALATKSIEKIALVLSGKLRLALNMWRFPFEMYVYNLIYGRKGVA